jgi:hypothetical protein
MAIIKSFVSIAMNTNTIHLQFNTYELFYMVVTMGSTYSIVLKGKPPTQKVLAKTSKDKILHMRTG